MSQFLQQCNDNWKSIHGDLFPNGIPNKVEWTQLGDIINVLNIIGKGKGMNHTFMPRSGGLDLEGASESNEPNHLELDFRSAYIVLPEKLIFNGFNTKKNKTLEWNYFELITKPMQKSGVRGQGDVDEEVTELHSGQYVERSAWEEKEYNERPLPGGAHLVNREISGGNYVIFNKASTYNQIINNYAGKHNQMGSEGFRNYISEGIKN